MKKTQIAGDRYYFLDKKIQTHLRNNKAEGLC